MSVRAVTAILAGAACVAAVSAQTASPPAVADPVAQRAVYNAMPDTKGTGLYPAIKGVVSNLPDHVVYRPADLSPFGPKRALPILVWGNGGCSDDGASPRFHLSEIASHGYVAIAPGRILSGPGTPPRPPAPPAGPGTLQPVKTTTAALTAAIDWAVGENARPGSPFRSKLDVRAIAVAGHSCGGLQALQAAADPRVRAVIIHNSGVFVDGTNPIPGITVDKSLLRRLHTPILYILGGKTDVAYPNGMDDYARIDHVPAMVANIDSGHGGTFMQPNGGAVASVALAWLDWQLKHEATAGRWFAGSDCRLCRDPKWTVQRKKID